MSKTTVFPELDEVEETEQRTKPFRGYCIIVFNDDDHSFEYVVELFMKVFRYQLEKCVQLAMCIHKEGLTVVWNGTKELGELKIEQLRSGGPDFRASKPVTYPILCELQPVN
jgi:ATP-dependent Clp protease adaptor protein ClpS